MIPEKVLCPECDADVTIVQRQASARDGKRTVTYMDELSTCANCGEEFYTIEQSLANSRAIAAAIRQQSDILSPDEIRAARIRLKMSQAEFEDALGVGRKTVVRWERGTVAPSRAARGLLWIAAHRPEAFLDYAKQLGASMDVVIHDSAVVATIIPAVSTGISVRIIKNATSAPKQGASADVGAKKLRKAIAQAEAMTV